MIPARIGSKGISQKVIRPFLGKPLIFFSIDLALNIPNSKVYVNTDSTQISDLISKEYKSKIKIFLRDKEFGDDDITLDELVLNFLTKNNFKNEFLLTIQPTSPLIKLDTVIKFLINYKTSNYNSFITVKENRKLEWGKNKNGVYKPLYKKRLNRQFLLPKYTETGALVISKIKLILSTGTRFNSSTGIFNLDARESIDIDTYEDWSIAEALFKSKKIIFYTSANKKLGSGHLKRCLSIAFNFPSYDILFVLHKTDEVWIKEVESYNYGFTIDNTKDISNRIKLFKLLNPSLIILDNLNTSEKLITSIKKNLSEVKIISFEDLGKGSLYTDLTINELYPPTINSSNILSGPNYCFFRDEFLRTYSNLNETIELKKSEKKYDIVISFGGTDPNNLSVRVLKIINQIKLKPLKIRIILGLGAQSLLNLVKNIASKSIHKIVYDNPKNEFISNEFINSKIGITGGGRTVYEFNVCNVKTIVLCQNSRELTHLYASELYGVKNLGLHSEVSDEKIKNMINILLNKKIEKNHFQIDPNISNHNVINEIKRILK